MKRRFVKGNTGHAYRQAGFTLIELMVVVAIIGLLASIILASLSTAKTKSRDARRIADVRDIQSALELYATKNGQYPTALAQLVADSDIQALPSDPQTATTYAYVAYSVTPFASGPGSCNNGYHLGALLESTPSVTHAGSTGNGAYRCAGSTYTGNSDCAATGVCLAASVGDFSGTGNVYDVVQ